MVHSLRSSLVFFIFYIFFPGRLVTALLPPISPYGVRRVSLGFKLWRTDWVYGYTPVGGMTRVATPRRGAP